MADPTPTELLRIALGTGLIQSGYIDQDEDGTVDVLQWHACTACPRVDGRCACSGMPYLSDAVWDAADRFGDLTAAIAAIETRGATETRTDIAANLTAAADYLDTKRAPASAGLVRTIATAVAHFPLKHEATTDTEGTPQ